MDSAATARMMPNKFAFGVRCAGRPALRLPGTTLSDLPLRAGAHEQPSPQRTVPAVGGDHEKRQADDDQR